MNKHEGGLCWLHWLHCVPLTCHVEKGKKSHREAVSHGPFLLSTSPFHKLPHGRKTRGEESYGKRSLFLTCQPFLSLYSTNTLSLSDISLSVLYFLPLTY